MYCILCRLHCSVIAQASCCAGNVSEDKYLLDNVLFAATTTDALAEQYLHQCIFYVLQQVGHTLGKGNLR